MFQGVAARQIELPGKLRGKLPVCLVFLKDRIEWGRANWQFAPPSRPDFNSFKAPPTAA
jgi:hypothetical protein